MDERLVAWALQVKSRQRGKRILPPIWLFTDAKRLPDPVAVARRLPSGAAGIVLRDDHLPARAVLARMLARICRQRRLVLAVAGDWRLAAALGAGVHLRSGRRPAGLPRGMRVLTSSAHSVPDLYRARWAGAQLVFLSPVYPTASHLGAAVLGPLRWGLAQRQLSGGAAALGGIDGATVRRLAKICRAVGAIGALD